MLPNPDVVFRVLGDDAVLVDLSTNRVYELNITGVAIWDALVRGEDPDTITSGLVARFDIDSVNASREVARVLGELHAIGLVKD